MGLFQKIGAWFTSLFDVMKRAFNKLSQIEKDVSVKASAIIALINANLTQTPEAIFKLIQLRFPDVTPAYLSAKLSLATKYLGIGDEVASRSFEENIKLLQGYLSKFEGNGWVVTTLGAVNALLTAMLPDTTPLQKISVLLEYIYQKIVKGKLA